jgi:hypothetical protein
MMTSLWLRDSSNCEVISFRENQMLPDRVTGRHQGGGIKKINGGLCMVSSI